MNNGRAYSYSSTIKSAFSDELINTYLIRPVAGILVRAVYPTRISPNQITLASVVAGIVAAFLYAQGTATMNLLAGLCVTVKDTLDSADGQLARAKLQFSRAGRFLDSIGDFLVNAIVLGGISYALFLAEGSPFMVVLGVLAFAGTTLRVSYHVFYQTSYLHLHDKYDVNRITEEIREGDMHEEKTILVMQRVFQFLYGWQDALMVRLDAWCRRGRVGDNAHWYGDAVALRLSGLIGLGTELFVLMLFSVANSLEAYLYVNAVAMNGVWLATVVYRRSVLVRKISATVRSAGWKDSQ